MSDTKAARATHRLQTSTDKHSTVACHVPKQKNPSLHLRSSATAHSQRISTAAVELPRSNCGPVHNSESNERVSPVEMARGMGVMRVASGLGGFEVKKKLTKPSCTRTLWQLHAQLFAQHQVERVDSTGWSHLQHTRATKTNLKSARG